MLFYFKPVFCWLVLVVVPVCGQLVFAQGHTTNDEQFAWDMAADVFAEQFPAVCAVSVKQRGWGSGVLIAPDKVLTARHCVEAPDDHLMTPEMEGIVVLFGKHMSAPLLSRKVVASEVPDGVWDGSVLGGRDIIILTLEEDVPDSIAPPMQLTSETATLIGRKAAFVGYGVSGCDSYFASLHEGTRHLGENIIDYYGLAQTQAGVDELHLSSDNSPAGEANIFHTDFDDGTDENNTLGRLGSSRRPLFMEATTGLGDSGGPILVTCNGKWVVAGILSDGTDLSSGYGDISFWTGVGPFKEMIEASGGQFVR